MEDGLGSKRQAQGNVESMQRNLQSALPEMIAELKASPENLTSTFKLYRNLDALYDVFESVAESTGAFGSKDEFQSLENDVGAFEKARRSFADRMETLAGAKELRGDPSARGTAERTSQRQRRASKENCGGRYRASEESRSKKKKATSPKPTTTPPHPRQQPVRAHPRS